MVDFNNTEIAFAHCSQSDLRRAFVLFRTLGSNSLVQMGKLATHLAFASRLPIDPLFRMTLFKQFVGGETVSECESTIARLAEQEIGSILDYSAEGKSDEASFEHTLQELLQVLDKASGDQRIPFGVFKVTGLARSALLEKLSQWQSLTPGEEAEFERVRTRIERICARAVEVKTPVFIDAEESWIQPVIDRLALEMMRKYNSEHPWIWNTLQMYRRDRLAYLKDLFHFAEKEGFHLGLKLVRGAYMEKERERAARKGLPSPIHPSKAHTDKDFDEAVELCLERIQYTAICAGSHNENSNYHLIQLMQEQGLAHDHERIYFAQLLGMSDHISYNLAHAGYRVVKYVPFAPLRDLVPYLIRRAEENTSVRGQSSRELQLLQQEMRRRNLL